MKNIMRSTLVALSLIAATPAFAAGTVPPLPQQDWSFEGIGGTFDKAQILRGWKVANQLCLQCHGIKYISARDLTTLGLTEDQAKAIAAELDKKLDEKLVSPLAPEDAKATYGLVPPDLSVITSARHDGSNYVYALLTGYTEAPADFTGTNYNKVFPGNNIAMPNPIVDGAVDYADGTATTAEQYARDVTAFLTWAADPHRETRQKLGAYVLLYVLAFAALSFVTMKMIWRGVKK